MSMKVTCGEFVGLAYASDDELREFAEEILAENAKLRELVVRMRPICVEGKRCTFSDRIHINSTMEELGIEVGE